MLKPNFGFHYFYIGVVAFLLCSCLATKYLNDGEQLYEGAKIKFENPEFLHSKSEVESALLSLTKPQPNTKDLGFMKTRLWFHNIVKKTKREKGFRKMIKYKLGEEPVLFSEQLLKRNRQFMLKYLHDHGYFGSQVSTEKVEKNKKVTVVYHVRTHGQYTLRKLHFTDSEGGEVQRLFRDEFSESEMQPGDAYNGAFLDAERKRLSDAVRQHGYYFFAPTDVFYIVDTSVGSRQFDLHVRLKKGADSLAHDIQTIRKELVYTDFSLKSEGSNYDTLKHENFTVLSRSNNLGHRILSRVIKVRPGQVYSIEKHQLTIDHLLDLGIFKFVNIKYTKADTTAPMLDCIIQLTPSLKQDLSAELEADTKSGNFLGTSGSVKYLNRNSFRGAELFGATAKLGLENQIAKGEPFVNTIEVSGELNLVVPMILGPFGKKRLSSKTLPKTVINIGDQFERRIESFTLNSFYFNFGYIWSTGEFSDHTFFPFTVNRVKLYNTTSSFEERLDENPQLQSSFDDAFILGILYQYNFNNQNDKTRKNYMYFRAEADLTGNVHYLLQKWFDKNDSEPYSLFGIPFSHYGVLNADYRYYFRLGEKQQIVFRGFGGIGLPYGNSEVLPYVKHFFTGGTNSVRAYRYRTLGPGGYDAESESSSDFDDQAGNIKLEFNAEYRFDVLSFLEGALFLDAGNIWLLDEDTARTDAHFSKSRFLKELALGAGIGARLDFGFFIIRFDGAFPLRRPELPEDERWVVKSINPLNKAWRKDNLILNIAIGYPF